MKLLPARYANLVLGNDWLSRSELAEMAARGVRVGSHVEIDVDLAPDYVREALVAYAEANQQVARSLESGETIGPWVVVSTPIYVATQQAGTKSKNRGDLVGELAGLREMTDVSDIAEALLASSVNQELLASRGVEFIECADARTVLRVRIEGRRDWPVSLGGAASPNEIERYVTLSANHASWRDRMVRRLTRVDVVAVELLADPAPFTQRITNHPSNAATMPVLTREVEESTLAFIPTDRNTHDHASNPRAIASSD